MCDGPFPYTKTSGKFWWVWLLGVPEVLWGFSGFLKTSGTLGKMSLLRVPEVLWGSLDFWKPLVHLEEWDSWVYQRAYGVLWIFEDLWYTWENEIPGVPEGYRVLWFFEIILGEWDFCMYQNSIVFSGFSRKSGIFFVEGRTSRRKGANNKNCYFLIFLISFPALAADKTPRITSCQRILGAWKCLWELVIIRFSPSQISWVL